ncbi:hypothetical protein KL928_000808 [Ogataea angusta]|uniref:Uncharacterized protein n=1 Tax=Pichia angusta TaxID=870730 RepID=A0AAN6I6W6_PICAN|nr:uncharacterized protein KL928_000808 [Ogataea angusta]KAG7820724.1 hypothetical protein KL928_000808 [Ogataea angusta]
MPRAPQNSSIDDGNGLEVRKRPGGITDVLGKTFRKVGGPNGSDDSLSNTSTNTGIQRKDGDRGSQVNMRNTSLSSQLGTHGVTTVTDGGEDKGSHDDTERRAVLHLGRVHHQSEANESDTGAEHLEDLVPTEVSKQKTVDDTERTQTHGLSVVQVSPVSVGKIQNNQIVRAEVKQPEVATHLVAEVDDDAANEGSVQQNALRKQRVWSNPNLVDSVHDEENSSDNFHSNHRRVVPSAVGVRIKRARKKHEGESKTEKDESQSVDLDKSDLDFGQRSFAFEKSDLRKSDVELEGPIVDFVVHPENHTNGRNQCRRGDNSEHTVTPSPIGSGDVLDDVTCHPGGAQVRRRKETVDGGSPFEGSHISDQDAVQ